jgi:NAD(P)-dependent dehydrogenase (short-subunit alcohol dehydrogenase family)
LSVAGKRILVTGCGGGIGSAISADIAEHGGELVATDRGDAGADLARRLNAVYFPLDVTDEANWLDVAQQVATRYGTLDGLVNNAGVILMKPLLQTTLADYRRINAINNEGVFLGMRTLAPLLAKSASPHGASIVNFSSIYGLGGQPGFAAYCAAKGAVRLVTKAAALEFAQIGFKIRVNSVHPGPIDTPLARAPIEALVSAGALASVDAGMASVAASYPGGRIGMPDDVAGVVTFLLSDAARFVNGVELPVDYGFTAKAQ